MTTALIAPVIPSATRPAGHGRSGSGVARSLPLAGPPASPPPDVVYGIGRVDASGRVADRAVTCALGWDAGDRLTLTAEAGVVVVRRDPGGMVTVPSRPCVVIPAALRHRCGLRAGDRVLLAALPGEDALAVYSLAVVDQAIRAHGAFPHRNGGQP
jgi:bifunctional DNA-binding transcriptional regulator/antitoxin component of YhaV-PrlF toxin-antitoxin module